MGLLCIGMLVGDEREMFDLTLNLLFLQPGTFDLVGTIVYEIDEHPYQSVFYNGTIEVVESGGFLSVESVFLVTLGVALLVLLGLWIHGQLQRFTKVLYFALIFYGHFEWYMKLYEISSITP